MSYLKPLEAQALYQACDLSQFDFNSTAELEELGEVIGQARALEAVHFGIGIKKNGYNIFALGPAGTGKHNVVTQLLTQQASTEEAPCDWCYVNNFDTPHKPIKICLPQGLGRRLHDDMKQLVEELRAAIPALFESDEYRARVQELEDELKEEQERAIEEIRQAARDKNIALIRTPNGFAFAPMRGEEVINPKEFSKLPDEVKHRFEAEIG